MTEPLDLIECEGAGDSGALLCYRTPVTNAAYWSYVRSSGEAPPAWWGGGEPPGLLASHPVVDVTLEEARSYCLWLSTEAGVAARLPTALEWEWIAQGPDGRRFPWGDVFNPGRCNSWEAAIGTTTPVDAFPEGAGPFGTLDQAGNVWEWCESFDEDGWTVVKGGCYLDTEGGVVSARRLSVDPARRTHTSGFRPVVDSS